MAAWEHRSEIDTYLQQDVRLLDPNNVSQELHPAVKILLLLRGSIVRDHSREGRPEDNQACDALYGRGRGGLPHREVGILGVGPIPGTAVGDGRYDVRDALLGGFHGGFVILAAPPVVGSHQPGHAAEYTGREEDVRTPDNGVNHGGVEVVESVHLSWGVLALIAGSE